MLWQTKEEICKPQDILEKLWPGETSVQGRQDDIYTIVKEIRKRFTEVIGKDIIENIPKVGYRLKIGSSGNA
jgi:DNA-binding winged helix-turn-helix (wHTH) protein